MKYVVFKCGKLLHPVIFADHTSHCQVKLEGGTPISAGFVHEIAPGVVRCYGKSDSLDLQANAERDKELIEYMLLNFGTSTFFRHRHMSAKSMKRAEAKLAEARQYLKDFAAKEAAKSELEKKHDAYRAKYTETMRQKPKAAMSKPIAKPTVPTYNGQVLDKAEVKKVKKGEFHVIAWSRGQRIEVPNRFKSTVRAQEWIAKHVAS